MNITALELRSKLYIYSIFTDCKFFDLHNINPDDYLSDNYLSLVKGFIEMESRDEEVKIMFNWKAIGGGDYEEAFDFNIDIYDCENSIEIEGRTLVDEIGRVLNKKQTTYELIRFLDHFPEWQSKIRTTLPVAATKLGE